MQSSRQEKGRIDGIVASDFHIARLRDAIEMAVYFEDVKPDPQGKQRLEELIGKISLQQGVNRLDS